MSRDTTTAADIVRSRGVKTPIAFGLILGTGLAPVVESIDNPTVIPYGDLPGFPTPGVSGHQGRLVVGTCEGVHVAVLEGRSHYYEAGDVRGMKGPLQTLKALGAHSIIVTNSSGSVNLDWHPGTIVLISDHINFAGANPLIGETGDERFVNLAEAYDKWLRRRMKRAAERAGANVPREGVYMWFSGPSFETPAEVRMAKALGADLVGMSTVPEVILARYLDLKVLGLSVVTNFATGLNAGDPSHAETKDIALSSSVALRRVLRAFFKEEASSYA